MNNMPPELPTSMSLEQLLLRDDMWMGHSQRFMSRSAVDTGYEELNAGLLNRGWPLGGLVEICQQGMQGEWQLFTPSLLELPGLIVLLNPPAAPFCQAFIQAGIDLERLIVVAAPEKNHFIACFIELARASVGAVMAWQPKAALTYTELRKCLLAASEGTGLSVMFRPSTAQQQSSPAGLRLFAQMIPTGLEITVFKQKGHLQIQQPRPIVLPLPDAWQPALSYHSLNQKTAGSKQTSKPKRIASVTPLRGKP
jgi:protein ImuA